MAGSWAGAGAEPLERLLFSSGSAKRGILAVGRVGSGAHEPEELDAPGGGGAES